MPGSHSARSGRQLRKAVAKARSANRAELTPEQARRLDGLEAAFSQHADMIGRLDKRDREREEQIRALRRDTSGDIAQLSEQVQRMADTLARHGIPATPPPAASPAVAVPAGPVRMPVFTGSE